MARESLVQGVSAHHYIPPPLMGGLVLAGIASAAAPVAALTFSRQDIAKLARRDHLVALGCRVRQWLFAEQAEGVLSAAAAHEVVNRLQAVQHGGCAGDSSR